MHGFHLTHDVHDAQLIDRRQDKIGRVDGLVLEIRENQPVRVAAILIGGEVRAERVGRWMVRLRHAMRALTSAKTVGTSRIPFRAVRCVGVTIELDVEGRDLESGHTERWLAEHVIERIPGGGAGEK